MEKCITTMSENGSDTQEYADAWHRLGVFLSLYCTMAEIENKFRTCPEWYFSGMWNTETSNDEEYYYE